MQALIKAGRDFGWLLALVAVALTLVIVWATRPPVLTEDVTRLTLPAFPIDLQKPSDIACNAKKVEKGLSIGGGGSYWTYTAQHTNPNGSSAFLRWTDGPGLDKTLAIQINGGPTANPDADKATRDCLKRRAVKAAGSLE